jgi:sortase A
MVLEIPRLGVRRLVPDGATVQNLKQYGVGHISWTAFPQAVRGAVADPIAAAPDRGGIVAIAGHRTTYGAPFYRIGTLRTGDAVVLLYAGRRYVYRVDRQLTTRPSDVEALDGDADTIALVTCAPPFSAAFRLIVFGHLERVTADRALTPGR